MGCPDSIPFLAKLTDMDAAPTAQQLIASTDMPLSNEGSIHYRFVLDRQIAGHQGSEAWLRQSIQTLADRCRTSEETLLEAHEMVDEAALPGVEETDSEQWIARRLHPMVLAYLTGVFLVMMGIAYFAVHSMSAVKALALAGVGSLVAVLPELGRRIEYRLIGTVLEKRAVWRDRQADFELVFDIRDVEVIKRLRRGFKYFKKTDDLGSIRRVWKTHLCDDISGEVHVEPPDLTTVLARLRERGAPIR
jgi:hypothetical protein